MAATQDLVDPPPHPYRWAMLGGVWLVYFCFALSVSSTAPLVRPIIEELGFSLGQMGSLMGAWPLVYIFSAIPAGAVLDRFGLRRSLFIGTLIIAASGVMRAFADDYLSFFFAIGLFGIGGPLISVGAPKLIHSWFSSKERGLAMGIYVSGPALGSISVLALTNSVVMPLVDFQWRTAILVYAGFSAAAAFVWLLISSSPKARAVEANATVTPVREQVRVFTDLVRLRPIQIVLVMSAGIFAFNHGMNNWLPEMLTQAGMSLVQAGYWATIPTAIGIVAALVIPRLARPGRRVAILVTVMLCAGSAAMLIAFAGGSLLAGGLILQGVARGTMTPILMLILMESKEVESHNMGAAGGLFFSAAEIGGVLGPLTVGLLADATGGFVVPLSALALVCLLVALLAVSLRALLHPRTIATSQ